MKVVHRISFSSTPEIQHQLATLGVDVPPLGLVSFEVEESDPVWPSLRSWIPRHHAVDVASTHFTPDEITVAPWLELQPTWHRGYPQPDEANHGFLSASYDLTDFCEACGTGLRQQRPFQMKSEPKWGRNSVLQLNWVFDEFFVKPDLWEQVFKPHGIICRPVINRKKAELHTVVQLVVEEKVGIHTKGLPGEVCERCHRMKYEPISRGAFPRLTGDPSSGLAKTTEYFGSGRSAFQGVVISRELWRELDLRNIRGVSVRPVADRASA